MGERIKVVEVIIQNKKRSSLLMHRFSEDAQVAVSEPTRKAKVAYDLPRDAAEKVAYRDPDGLLYFPGAAIIIQDDMVPLFNVSPGSARGRLEKYEVDSRPVVIPSTKGVIMRHRPRLDAWEAEFTMEVDEEILDCDFVQQLLSEGGRRVGIGDFRPSCGGGFGRFEVIQWKVLDD